jgi:thiamine-phosphate pyrophosphorylase
MERAIYRIIDANFNRAREAIRIIEDFCRFALDSDSLTGRAKQLRHELSATIGKLDAGRLISSRDTVGDVGASKTADKQLGRSNLRDCFTAGCKRLTEALRTLAETTQTQDRSVAETIEKLRFSAYKLEKDIVLFSEPAEKFKRVRLYIIISSPPAFLPATLPLLSSLRRRGGRSGGRRKQEGGPVDFISLTNQCAAGGADCIQLRAKGIEDDKLFAIAVEFVQICKDAGVLSIINDRADVAVAAGADGVHLGQNDLPIDQARRLQLVPLIIGKSTHSLAQLRAACEQCPTYMSLGPVFATVTKPSTEPVGLGYVRQATKKLAGTGIGSVAVGGITLDNVEDVLAAGAESVAVCSAVTETVDPTAACRALKEKIAAFKKNGY